MWKREELNNMKVLVTGVKGQLGYDIVKECEKRNIDAIGVDIDEMDITNPAQVEEVIKDAKVDAVIHCAAWTAVDKAEDEIELCRKVNKEGPANIAKVCEELDIPMMYFSTDYVFDGQGEEPWMEYGFLNCNEKSTNTIIDTLLLESKHNFESYYKTVHL